MLYLILRDAISSPRYWSLRATLYFMTGIIMILITAVGTWWSYLENSPYIGVEKRTIQLHLDASDHASREPYSLTLTIPGAYFERDVSHDVFDGKPSATIILNTLFPTMVPEPVTSQQNRLRADAIRIILSPITAPAGVSKDEGLAWLNINLRGVDRLYEYGHPEGTPQIQQYLSKDGRRAAYTFVDDHGNTVYLDCFIRTCEARRTWKTNYRVSYQISKHLERRFADVDQHVLSLLERFTSKSH